VTGDRVTSENVVVEESVDLGKERGAKFGLENVSSCDYEILRARVGIVRLSRRARSEKERRHTLFIATASEGQSFIKRIAISGRTVR